MATEKSSENLKDDSGQTFWDHLDVLRGVLIRVLIVVLLLTVVAFVFKDEVFGIVLAPKSPDFVLYRWLSVISAKLGFNVVDTFDVELINTGLAQQFMIHMKTAFCVALIVASPYILHQLFGFVSPALYANERKYSVRLLVGGYVMFLFGVALSYFLIFPLTFRFLGTYQVSSEVTNLISLESYMSVLIMLCLFMGIMCELPVLSYIATKAGIIDSGFLKRYRRHAILVILVVCAIITPTSDAFTLLIVSLPIWLLYEASILISGRAK
ncbi:MAG: twin-arginine translocase subunit TatC [Muribaculaceae bacterium]|nr:twin-arginine translocase subunit TatC [Muribaculaceae bacterium]MDE6631831.1 twin-arginine translocase subunit TatC [Muribaculaceae bacterium]